MISLISAAQVAETAAGPASNSFGSLFLLVGFVFIFYFMLWRPQSKRAKEHKQLITALNKGDEVITTGGLLGKITKVSDDFIEIDIADNVNVKIQKPAISASVPKGTFKAV